MACGHFGRGGIEMYVGTERGVESRLAQFPFYIGKVLRLPDPLCRQPDQLAAGFNDPDALATLAAVSRVSVLVMLCTRTGRSPPSVRLPICITLI